MKECWFLGGRYWNSPKLLSQSGEYADGALFVDAICQDCQASFELGQFLESFSRFYGEAPGFLEAYGHDTIMIIRHLLVGMKDYPDAEAWAEALAQCRDLPLATGLTTVQSDGEIVKEHYPLTIHHKTVESVNATCR